METMAELGCWPPSSSIENKSSGTEHMFVRARTCKWKQIRLNLEWKTSKCSSRIPLQFNRGSLFIPTLWWWCIANFRCIWEAVKYTMDAQVRYLLSSCQSAVCHRTFYVTELFMSQNFLSAICSTFFHSMTAITSVPPYCQALFLVPAKRSVLMPRICAISISINLSGCASTFFHRVRWEMHFTGVLISHNRCSAWDCGWRAIVGSILEALAGPESCWQKAL